VQPNPPRAYMAAEHLLCLVLRSLRTTSCRLASRDNSNCCVCVVANRLKRFAHRPTALLSHRDTLFTV
jgi:hypothetical protein